MKKQNIMNVVITIVALMMPMKTWCQSNETKLQILVPVREFNNFVTIKTDPITGVNNYSGFAIQVFEEVMTTLPSYSYVFVPFVNSMGTMNGSFDDMLQKVSSEEYDGAVGEITILYERSNWVDFTMPYLESSIAMLVPIEQQSSSTAGFSFITITTYVAMITSYALSLIVGLFYIVRFCNCSKLCGCKNDENRRDTTMRTSIQMKLLMTTFTLIVVILIATYILSQASRSNESQRGSATVKTLDQLISTGNNVGYREGSFLYDLLVIKGFDRSKLKSLKSEDDMVNKLSKGTSNGGVDAIIANAPHLKLLQAKYCDNFTIVLTPSLHTAGIGFAFGIKSDLGREVSKGILKITDNGKLGKIQDQTIGNLEACEDITNNNNIYNNVVFSYHSPQHKSIFIVGSIFVIFLAFLYTNSLFIKKG